MEDRLFDETLNFKPSWERVKRMIQRPGFRSVEADIRSFVEALDAEGYDQYFSIDYSVTTIILSRKRKRTSQKPDSYIYFTFQGTGRIKVTALINAQYYRFETSISVNSSEIRAVLELLSLQALEG